MLQDERILSLPVKSEHRVAPVFIHVTDKLSRSAGGQAISPDRVTASRAGDPDLRTVD